MSHSRTSKFKPADVQSALDKAFPDHRWRSVLEVLAYTGVADRQQILTTTGLSRNALTTLEEQFRVVGGREIMREAAGTFPWPGVRGKPPRVYLLGALGAALLRANGYRGVQPCGLTSELAIAHARVVTEIALLARRAELPIRVETTLAYGDNRVLRPDVQITVAEGVTALFEAEQQADLSLLPRIVESLRHKVAFYSSETGKAISRYVRVIFALQRDATWDKTVAVWQKASAIVATESGGRLPFEILGLPLSEFTAQRDWADPPAAAGWESLFDPAQTAGFALEPVTPKHAQTAGTPAKKPATLPATVARYTPHEQHLIMQAYLAHVREHGLRVATTDLATPLVFETFAVIFTASHNGALSAWQLAQHPSASLRLLHEYLDLNPDLRAALNAALVRGSGAMRWSSPTIQQRMLSVAEVFLRYHGLRNGGSLCVRVLAPWAEDSSGHFDFAVVLAPHVLMGDASGIVPTQEEAVAAGIALAWVLQALFLYPEDLDLRPAPFW